MTPNTEARPIPNPRPLPLSARGRGDAHCITGLVERLLGNGRDVTVIVGRRTDRKSGGFAVVMEEERN